MDWILALLLATWCLSFWTCTIIGLKVASTFEPPTLESIALLSLGVVLGLLCTIASVVKIIL